MFLVFKETCGHVCLVNDKYIMYIDDLSKEEGLSVVMSPHRDTCEVEGEIHVAMDIEEGLMIQKAMRNGEEW